MERRTFLSSLLTVGTVAIAGCSGGGNNNPKATVETFASAYVEGDAETVNKQIYEDGEYSKVSEEEFESYDGEVLNREIRELTASEAAEMTGQEVQKARDALETLSSLNDVDDSALVYWKQKGETPKGRENTIELMVFLVKSDEKWLMYDQRRVSDVRFV